MKMRQWYDILDGMSEVDRKKYIEALETLKGWAVFKREFEWCHLFVLINMLKGGNNMNK